MGCVTSKLRVLMFHVKDIMITGLLYEERICNKAANFFLYFWGFLRLLHLKIQFSLVIPIACDAYEITNELFRPRVYSFKITQTPNTFHSWYKLFKFYSCSSLYWFIIFRMCAVELNYVIFISFLTHVFFLI